jgi:predicted permease
MIACIALGIGPGLAMFGIVDTVLFKSLPVAEPDALVVLTRRASNDISRDFPYPFFDLVSRSTATLQTTAAWYPAKVAARIGERSAELTAELVSTNYFSTLGVPMTRGTTWQAVSNDTRGVILSHRYWTTVLGSDASIVGRPMIVQGVPVSVIGVTGRDFFGMQVGTFVDIWLSMDLAPVLHGRPELLVSHTQWWSNIVGRRRAGVSLEQCNAELDGAFKAYRRSVAGGNAHSDRLGAIEREALIVREGGRGISRVTDDRSRLVSWMSVVGVCIVLLVFTDLAAVMLGKLAQRGAELATRLSMGASLRNLYAQIVIEEGAIVAAGTLVGVLVWYWVRPFVPRLLFGATIQLDLSSSWRLIMAAAATTLLGTLLLASIAIRWIARRDLMTLLATSGLSGGSAKRPASLGWSLGVLFLQVALSVAMVLEASAFARSLANLSGRDLGFESGNIVMARMDARNAALSPQGLAQLREDLLQRARGWPGTTLASVAWTAPLDSAREVFDQVRISRGGPPCTVKSVDLQVVGRDYFGVLGIPFVIGGPPTADSRAAAGGPMPAVVNETFARRCADTGTMLGRTTDGRGIPSLKIVGVVKNVQYHGLKEKTGSVLYVPADQWPSNAGRSLTLLVRTRQPVALLAGLIRSETRQLNREVGIREITTIAAQVHELLGPERTLAQATRFAMLLGLLLVGVGIYGSLTQRINGRWNEFALRLALGARLRQVVWGCVRAVATVLVAGAAVGYLLSVSLRGITRSLLFGTITEGAETVLVSVVIVLLVAAVAASAPLLRLRRLDLATALRRD